VPKQLILPSCEELVSPSAELRRAFLEWMAAYEADCKASQEYNDNEDPLNPYWRDEGHPLRVGKDLDALIGAREQWEKEDSRLREILLQASKEETRTKKALLKAIPWESVNIVLPDATGKLWVIKRYNLSGQNELYCCEYTPPSNAA
jgi:hypothetical protein